MADLNTVDFGDIFDKNLVLYFDGEFICEDFVECNLGGAPCVIGDVTEVDTFPKVSVIASLAELPSGGHISSAVSSLTGRSRLTIAAVSSG